MAALTGFLAVFFSPLIVLLVLPLSLRRILSRYRPYHPGFLTSGQGARLGAFTGLLSFIPFLVFFLATISLEREAMLTKIHEIAAQNPDPQVQQGMLWFTTDAGFIVFTGLVLLMVIFIFLAVGAISGTWIASSPKNRP